MTTDATVFVVDDNVGVRKSLRALLESAGLAVETYASGEEFLAAYDPERPGCLVLDVRLRHGSGLDVQDELRRRKTTLPIIVLTGHGNVPTSVRALKAGAVDFLQKPAPPKLLLERVRAAINSDRQARYTSNHHYSTTGQGRTLGAAARRFYRLDWDAGTSGEGDRADQLLVEDQSLIALALRDPQQKSTVRTKCGPKRIVPTILPLLILLMADLGVFGCASTWQMFPGPPLPSNSIARLHRVSLGPLPPPVCKAPPLPSFRPGTCAHRMTSSVYASFEAYIEVLRIDGQRVPSSTSTIEILPGIHNVSLYFPGEGPDQPYCSLSFEAGAEYRIYAEVYPSPFSTWGRTMAGEGNCFGSEFTVRRIMNGIPIVEVLVVIGLRHENQRTAGH